VAGRDRAGRDAARTGNVADRRGPETSRTVADRRGPPRTGVPRAVAPGYHRAMPGSIPLPDHVRAFLEGPHVAAIATVDPDGSPRQTVAWYRLEPDGRVLLNSRAPRRWPANLRRDGRVALAIGDGADPRAWVGLTGIVAEVVEDVERAREDIVALAWRYERPEPRPQLIADFRTQARVTFLVRVTGFHDHLSG
jgi:PPOX class probable F420-dependent enzyme